MPYPIYWILVISMQASPEVTGFFPRSELEKYSAFRFPKRRDEWLLGRWAAKTLLHNLPAYRHYWLDQIEIRNAPGGRTISAICPAGRPGAECLTISHSGNLAICALSDRSGTANRD